MNNLGLWLIVMGILVMVGTRIIPSLGHLPGDFLFHGKCGTLYLPLTTGLIVGVVASFLVRVFCRT